MTKKKAQIIDTALQLFARNGFNAVSTAEIAKQAEVSEGLIFRHFGSKKGLLDYIYSEMEQRLEAIYHPILEATAPKEVIRLCIESPFKISNEDMDYWRLLFRLKWQEGYDTTSANLPLVEKGIQAFKALGYEQPELETQLLERTIEGIATTIMQSNQENQWPLRDFLLKKYDIPNDNQ